MKEKQTGTYSKISKKKIILDELAKGTPVRKIRKYLEDNYQLSQKTIRDLIAEVISEITSEEEKEALKASNLVRLDEIVSDCINDGDRKNAIRAIDTLNKSIGAYTEKVEIQSDGEICLNFNL